MSDQMISSIEQELDDIRIKLHEETKDMTLGERVAYLRKKADDGLRASGYKYVPASDNRTKRLVRV